MRARAGTVIAAALLTLAGCTTSSARTPTSSSSTSSDPVAGIVAGRNAIEKAVRTYGGVTAVDSELDYQYGSYSEVEIHVTSNRFFADVGKTAIAAATRVKTKLLPDITITTGLGADKQSLVLDGGYVGAARLPTPTLVDRAVAVFSDQPLLLNGSGLTVRAHEPDLYVAVQAENDTSGDSIALYRTLLAKWRPADPAVKRLDVGRSFVVMADISRRTVPVIANATLLAWQHALSQTKVIGSTLRSDGDPEARVQLTLSPFADRFDTGRRWIDALVHLGKRFSIRGESEPKSAFEFEFHSYACAMSDPHGVTPRLYKYYAAAYPKLANLATLKDCR